jgi:nucleotide sugar dehydrogenase
MKVDIENINKFVKINADKKIVVIQGIGFVGVAMALVVANSMDGNRLRYAVIGVDLPDESSYWKIAMINKGLLPIQCADPKMTQYLDNATRNGNLMATCDSYAYSVADIIIVDVQLDVIKQNVTQQVGATLNIDSFKTAIEVIGKYMQPGTLVIVETTIPPGTCECIVKPILEKAFVMRGLPVDNLLISHSYERVMPGSNYIDSIQNYFRVLSGINEKSAKIAESFFKTIIDTVKYPLTIFDNTNASEIAKLLENTFRATNIALLQEWTVLAEKMGVNLFEVINAIRKRDTHRNIMFPGFGVGGYCLPKDPLFADRAAKELFKMSLPMEMSLLAVAINDLMPRHVFNHIKAYKSNLYSEGVAIFGISYSTGVADTRNTPVEIFYTYLFKENARIFLHDPIVKFWPEMNLSISNDLEEILDNNPSILVFTLRYLEYLSMDLNRFLQKLEGRTCLIVDCSNIFDDSKINLILDAGHDYIGIGKGHIGYLFTKSQRFK